MMFMNRYDIDDALAHFEHYRSTNTIPVRAAKFLQQFRDEVDSCSDGWAYWKAPVISAAKLMGLIQRTREEIRNLKPITATEAEFLCVLRPIKSFYTRKGYLAGMKFPEVAR